MPLTSLRSMNMNEACTRRASYYGAMAVNRLRILCYFMPNNIMTLETEIKAPSDSILQTTESKNLQPTELNTEVPVVIWTI